MTSKLKLLLFLCFLPTAFCLSQQTESFTRADTLRGSITAERAWWDVLRYDITVKPDFVNQTTSGSNVITYKVIGEQQPALQLDLKDTLQIDSIVLNKTQRLSFTREGDVWHVQTPKQKKSSVHSLAVYFSGKPRVAPRAPWDGGWTFTTDSLGRPWMTVTCQGLGASVWYPCKDHQSDEPN